MTKEEKFDQIIDGYESAFRQHGDSPASLQGAKGRQHLRFQALVPLVGDGDGTKSVLDYGCGLAHLLPFLRDLGWMGAYHGVDVVPSFIEHNRRTYPGDAEFTLISPDEPLSGTYDIVVASGVFNLTTHETEDKSKAYALNRIRELYSLCRSFLVCDFMTEYVDFKQDSAQHFSPQEIIAFAVASLSRRFVVRHDLMPYEFTLISYRDARIVHPDSVYITKAAS